MPQATTKAPPTAPGASDFQSTFVAAVKTPVVAGKDSDGKLVKSQGSETKKTTDADIKKKSISASQSGVGLISQPEPSSLNFIPVPSVPQSEDLVTVADPAPVQDVLTGIAPANGGGGNRDAAWRGDISGQAALGAVEVAAVPASYSDNPGIGDSRAKLVSVPMANPSPTAVSTAASKASDATGGKGSNDIEGASDSKVMPTSAFDSQTASLVPNAAVPVVLATVVTVPVGLPTSATVPVVVQTLDTVPVVLPTSSTLPQQISQQSFSQDKNVTPVPAQATDLKTSSAKSDGLAPANATPAKGKVAWSRTNAAADDRQDGTGAESDPVKARVEAPAVISKDVSAGTGAFAAAQTVVQSTQAAQASSIPNPAQVPHIPLQGTGVGASSVFTEGTQAAHAMSNAQYIQSAHGSEMRLGMQSAEFGNISINTSLNRQALSAQISIDHSALGHALAAHLPAIEEKLGSAYGVQAKVELRDTGSNSSLNDSSSRESKGNRQARTGQAGTSMAVSQSGIGAITSSAYTSTAAGPSRLDIRI